MNISPNEAEEALAAIQNITQKTRHSIAAGGTYIFLIATGVVWLIGFLATQFLSGPIVGYVWMGASVLGTALATVLGLRMGRRMRSQAVDASAKRAGFFWLLLAIFAVAVIFVAKPADGKQVATFIILFIMLGQLSMGMLVSYSSVWWALPISALALVGYFLLPGIFYAWMAVLGGGGMVALGLYIRFRW